MPFTKHVVGTVLRKQKAQAELATGKLLVIVFLPCKRHHPPASYVSSLDFGVPTARAEE